MLAHSNTNHPCCHHERSRKANLSAHEPQYYPYQGTAQTNNHATLYREIPAQTKRSLRFRLNTLLHLVGPVGIPRFPETTNKPECKFGRKPSLQALDVLSIQRDALNHYYIGRCPHRIIQKLNQLDSRPWSLLNQHGGPIMCHPQHLRQSGAIPITKPNRVTTRYNRADRLLKFVRHRRMARVVLSTIVETMDTSQNPYLQSMPANSCAVRGGQQAHLFGKFLPQLYPGQDLLFATLLLAVSGGAGLLKRAWDCVVFLFLFDLLISWNGRSRVVSDFAKPMIDCWWF